MALNDEVAYTDGDSADLTRACTRKRGYPTEEVARLAVSSIRSLNVNAQVRAYGCRHCGQWHVGGTPRAEQGFTPMVGVDDSFDAERDRRRRSPTRSRRRSYGDGYSRGRAPRRERHERD